MATSKKQLNAAKARRAAALLAGFDLGNPSDDEAVSMGRALRHMAADLDTRIVDLLETPEMRKAVDDQMQPVRQPGPELKEAVKEAADLRAELTERTRDVRKLADLLAGNEGKNVKLSTRPDTAVHSFGAQSGVFEIVVVVLGLIVMGMAIFQ